MIRRQSCLCALTILFLVTLSLTASTSQAQPNTPLSSTHLEWPAHFATPAGRVRVIITKNRNQRYLAKLPHPIARLFLDDNDDDYYDELPDVQVGYRRPEVIDQSADVELSDEIKIRLLLARKRALQAYHQNWS